MRQYTLCVVLAFALHIGSSSAADTRILFEAAQEEQGVRQPHEAIRLYQKVIETDRTNLTYSAPALVHLVECFQLLKGDAKAETLYRKLANKYISKPPALDGESRLQLSAAAEDLMWHPWRYITLHVKQKKCSEVIEMLAGITRRKMVCRIRYYLRSNQEFYESLSEKDHRDYRKKKLDNINRVRQSLDRFKEPDPLIDLNLDNATWFEALVAVMEAGNLIDMWPEGDERCLLHRDSVKLIIGIPGTKSSPGSESMLAEYETKAGLGNRVYTNGGYQVHLEMSKARDRRKSQNTVTLKYYLRYRSEAFMAFEWLDLRKGNDLLRDELGNTYSIAPSGQKGIDKFPENIGVLSLIKGKGIIGYTYRRSSNKHQIPFEAGASLKMKESTIRVASISATPPLYTVEVVEEIAMRKGLPLANSLLTNYTLLGEKGGVTSPLDGGQETISRANPEREVTERTLRFRFAEKPTHIVYSRADELNRVIPFEFRNVTVPSFPGN